MWIKGGRIIDPATKRDTIGDIEIEEGIIRGIHPGGKSAKKSEGIDLSLIHI